MMFDSGARGSKEQIRQLWYAWFDGQASENQVPDRRKLSKIRFFPTLKKD
jgi:hypothetical protein